MGRDGRDKSSGFDGRVDHNGAEKEVVAISVRVGARRGGMGTIGERGFL